jgi:hypothetical protein
LFFVIRQRRPYSKNQGWIPVSLFDSEGYYRGPTYFDSKAEAEAYLKIYMRRIEERVKKLSKKEADFGDKYMLKLKTKIFKEDRIPSIASPKKSNNLLTPASTTAAIIDPQTIAA